MCCFKFDSLTRKIRNESPSDIIAKVSGTVKGGIREDDGPYFTNLEGIPIPDAEHSKTIGGIPLVSDVHLLQKQQHFNRSRPLERESLSRFDGLRVA